MKRGLLVCVATPLIFLVGLPMANGDWVSTISSANPLHWFRFEEAPGASTADDQGSADADGTYLGNVSLGTPGLVGKAASFDGNGDHVLVAAPILSGDWTVETILKADTVNGGVSQGIVGADFTASDPMALKAEQYNESGQLGFTLFGVVDVTYTDPNAATPTDFTHVAFVNSSSGVELFVDGASVGADPITTSLSRHVLGAGAVRADGSLVDPLTGAIDELVIYDRTLTAEEISAHAAAAIPEPSAAGLLLLGLVGGLMTRYS